FDQYKIVPRMLNNVSERNTSVEILGTQLPIPLLLSPVGVLELAHRDADIAVAKAASATGIPFIFSNQASVPMEKVAGVMGQGPPAGGQSPRWFQMYWSRSRDLVASFAQRAEKSGGTAIVVTLDT